MFVILNRDDASLAPPKLEKGLKILEKKSAREGQKILILTAEGRLYYGRRGWGGNFVGRGWKIA